MNRETENTLLLLVGAGIGVVTVTQVFTRYVKPGLAWVLIPAAVLVVLLALAAIVGDIRRGYPGPSTTTMTMNGTPTAPGSPGCWWCPSWS